MDSIAKLDKLVAETEDLLDSLGQERTPKIDALRERLLDSLENAKRAIHNIDVHGNGREHASGSDREYVRGSDDSDTRIGIRDLAGSVNDYVRRHPWLALATGVLIAASAGILATSATKRSLRHGP